MIRARVGFALLFVLAPLAWAPPAAASEEPMRHAARLEVGAAGGWSGRGVLAAEGAATLRLGQLVGTLTVDLGQPPSNRHPSLRTLVSLGAGLVRDVGDWQASGTAFLSAHQTTYPDLLGIGRTILLSSGVGLRGGLGRYFGGPERRGKLVPWLGLSASVGFARSTSVRILDQRQTGWVALLSITVGAGLSLRGAFTGPEDTPP